MIMSVTKTCEKGHTFQKSSDCPVCPICEKERAPAEGFLSTLSAPARSALEHEGIRSVEELSLYSEKEVLRLHGVGPASLPNLRKALEESGLSFKK
ncbi:RNA polymerase alpha subunit C-terminal domain-containing protein [Bacillus sp. H-16]|nr:RNA polymerase alpha subunit C-terminal domain-containing protein [Alteribacter salitolerans]MBM7095205.1 RNA polymerase alpha subunit C-terminal domain-containing protein [Alteribacter salitolerans]